MNRSRRCRLLMVWLFGLLGHVCCMDVSFENPRDGFFLKELYHKGKIPVDNEVTSSFIVNQAFDSCKIKAGNGPFEAYQTIPQSFLETAHLKQTRNNSQIHRNVMFNMDVSAHIVSDEVSPKFRRLQVLIHASPHTNVKLTDKENKEWCAQIYVKTVTAELSSVCILNEKDGACVAGLDLPIEWWSQDGTLANVSYSLVKIDQNSVCASAANTIIPENSMPDNVDVNIAKQFISSLHLTLNTRSFDEWKDQDIFIDVPRGMFHHGESFEIPIRLEAASNLQVFMMGARVRQGLRITGARTADSNSQWSIHVDINERQKTGKVTAFVRDPKTYSKSRSVQEIFHWQLEVVEDLYDTDTGRIVWSIEYLRVGAPREHYTAQDSKIVSRINIHSKGQRSLVPILKVSEILNLAILTGNQQVYPMQIYAVDDADNFEDVTQQTKCHSVEVDVLKVSSDCTSIYVDGGESRGSHNVSIIAKFGRITAFLYITVWIPEDRLDIQLSDTRLSLIRGWKVGTNNKRSKRATDKGSMMATATDGSERCHLRLQQALVEVYTRFHIQSPHHTDYFLGRRAFLKITDLVKERMRMSDSHIASLSGNLIQGHDQGRTEIQILSPRNSRVLSAQEIRVGYDKVTVKGLVVRVVSGLTLEIQPSQALDGALTARAAIQSVLRSKYQEGVVDIDVQFSDMTTFPLRYIDPEDYSLEATSLNLRVIGIAPLITQYQPHIVAVGEGGGKYVKIVLRQGHYCRKRKAKVLATTYQDVESDFSQDKKQLLDDSPQSDAHFDSNRASQRLHGTETRKEPIHTFEIEGAYMPPKNSDLVGKKEAPFITINNDELGDLPRSDSVAKQEPLGRETTIGLTPIEIGMYILLAVFCVVLTVFMIKCAVFLVQYKQKQIPKPDKTEAISSANDWVWIGRATLERNAVNTRCSQTLMPDEDFNGNHTHTRPTSYSCSSGSAPSSAPNSNRNSTVSTYKGSECSIRITANPLSEPDTVAEETVSEGGVPQWDYEAMGMNYKQLMEYFDNLKESTA